MDSLTQYFIALLATGIINGSLGIFVILKGFNKRLNQLLALYSLSLFLWSVFEALGITRDNESLALLLWRINHIGVIFIPIFLVHFVFLLLDIKGRKKKLIPISYAVACIFLILDATPLLILEVVPKFSFRYFINPGPLYYTFFWMWIGWAVYGNVELFKEYFKTSGYRRNQMQYFCWSLLFSYIGGVPNFFPTFNIEIPILMPLGTYAIPLYALATAYAILRYRLMDIRVAVTRAGIFIIVYAFVLGIPFVFGYKYDLWQVATWIMLGLATSGPFIYLSLQRRAEDILLREQRQYQKTLRELSKTMARIRDLDKLLKAIVLTVVDTVKVSFAGIYLKDEDYKSYRLKHYFPLKAKECFQEFIPLDDNLIKVLYAQKRPLPSEEVGSQDKIQLDSGLLIPCFIEEDNLLGFLVLGSKPNNQMYTTDDSLVFETLSYSTSLAIENSQFWKEIEDRQRQARIAEMDLFSYSVAHEIDNPMTIIKGYAELLKKFFLKELNLPEDKRQEAEIALDNILEAQDRTSTMIKALEDYGKPVPAQLIPLKLEDVINSFLRLYLSQFKHHGVYFNKELPSSLPYIRGVKQELVQVMVNLSNNSIHALLGVPQGQEKHIHLKVELSNSDWVRISFSDNGYGIAKENLESIFVPFVTTKASTEGRGMGLFTVRKIIKKHHGKIWAESEGKGKGATFIIELPIAKDVTEEDFKKEDKGHRLY